MLLLLWCPSLRYSAIEKEGQQASEWRNGVTKVPNNYLMGEVGGWREQTTICYFNPILHMGFSLLNYMVHIANYHHL
jgi:hypothetical protein